MLNSAHEVRGGLLYAAGATHRRARRLNGAGSLTFDGGTLDHSWGATSTKPVDAIGFFRRDAVGVGAFRHNGSTDMCG
jgi:hypothetical protein